MSQNHAEEIHQIGSRRLGGGGGAGVHGEHAPKSRSALASASPRPAKSRRAGKPDSTALELWRSDVNASGGLLGRPVEFVVYDDQSQTSTVPGIYAKLLDIDKVDLLLSPYGTNLTAVVMPMIKQRNRFVIAQMEIGQNDNLKHDKFFEIAPWGPKPGANWCRGYFDLAKRQGYKTLAVISSDAEFSANAANSGVNIAQEYGMKVVSNQHYPPNSVDFSGILRNVNAAAPDFVFVASYPVEVGRAGP